MERSDDGATSTTRVFVPDETDCLPVRVQPTYTVPSHVKRLVAYAGAGFVGTVAHFAILFAASAAAGAVAASTLGASVGCLVNYSLSRHIVFHGRQTAHPTFPRFVVVSMFAVALNAVVLNTLIASLPLFFSQALSTLVVFLFTFAFNNGWTFSERQK